MTKFKATKRLPLAKNAVIRTYVAEHVELWEELDKTQAEVHEYSTAMMADAASGEEMVEGYAFYAKVLGAELKAAGCFLAEAPTVSRLKKSKYQ